MRSDIVDVQARQQRQQIIAAWSDESVMRVEQFIARHADQIGRGLTNAQMSGLQNIIRANQGVQTVLNYIERQRNKAERQNRMPMERFWRELATEFNRLEQEAHRLMTETGSGIVTELQYALIGEFVQHLEAEVRLQGRG